MKVLSCRVCGKTLGYVLDDSIYDEECLCEECFKKAEQKEVEFTIVKNPTQVTLECPFCGEEIEIEWEDFEYNNMNWANIRGEKIECPECNEYIKLGDFDVD